MKKTEKDIDTGTGMNEDVIVDSDQNIRSFIELANMNITALPPEQSEHLKSMFWLFTEPQSNEKKQSLALFFIIKAVENPGIKIFFFNHDLWKYGFNQSSLRTYQLLQMAGLMKRMVKEVLPEEINQRLHISTLDYSIKFEGLADN